MTRRCPDCGAPLDVVHTVVERPTLSVWRDAPSYGRRCRLALVAFCSRCDVAFEVVTTETGAIRRKDRR